MPLKNAAALTVFTSKWTLESEIFHLLWFKMGAQIPLEIGLLYCSVKNNKKKSKNSETLSGGNIFWNRTWEKRGWKHTQRRVSWWGGPVPWDWLALRFEDVKTRRALKATKASPCRWKWVHYNQRESCDGVFGGLNEQRPDSTAVRGTAGSVNVNKPGFEHDSVGCRS